MRGYKRLTDKEYEYKRCASCSYKNCQYCGDIYDIEKQAHTRLTELEDKLESGTLIELPCKVGDKVYIPYKFRNKNGVFETIIEEIRIEEKHILFWAKPLYTNNSVRVRYLGWKKSKDFNKTWFLTKAEAEARLKELQEKQE